jgi:membrane-associated protein
MEFINQILDFILHIDDHLVELIGQYGIYVYIILFLIFFAETGLVVAPFLPGDSLLFAAGALAATGNFNLFILWAVCIGGAIIGNAVNFYTGRYVGPRVFEKKNRFIKQEHLLKTRIFYEKHGGKALILGRFIPFIRTFVPFVAGIGKMDAGKFSFYNIVGAFLWVIPITVVGYLFGNVPFVKDNFSILVLVILLLSLIPLLYGIFKAWMLSFSKSEDE